MDIGILVYIANGTDWDMSHSFPMVHWDRMDIGILVYSEWDRLGYVPFFPHGTLGWDGQRDTCTHT